MEKIFNVSGACRPDRHYMVDLKDRPQSCVHLQTTWSMIM